MKSKEEIINDCIDKHIDSGQKLQRNLYELIWDAAMDAACESATTFIEHDGVTDDEYSVVDKQSILRLKFNKYE